MKCGGGGIWLIIIVKNCPKMLLFYCFLLMAALRRRRLRLPVTFSSLLLQQPFVLLPFPDTPLSAAALCVSEISALRHIKLCKPQHLICVMALCFSRPDEACNDKTQS